MSTLKDYIRDFTVRVKDNIQDWDDEDLEVEIELLLEEIKTRLIGV